MKPGTSLIGIHTLRALVQLAELLQFPFAFCLRLIFWPESFRGHPPFPTNPLRTTPTSRKVCATAAAIFVAPGVSPWMQMV